MTTLEFLRELYADAPDGWLTLWGPSLGTEWFRTTDLQRMAEAAWDAAKERDVYFGLGVRAERLGRGKRGGSSSVVAVPCAWLDLDVQGPAKAAGRVYAPSTTAALELLRTLPVKPTLVLATGGGLHAHWVFHEPLSTATDAEAAEAERVLRGWEAFCQRQAGAAGFEIDSTADLARVLRLPGTWNRKPDLPAPVRVEAVVTDGPRCDPADLAEYAVAPAASTGGGAGHDDVSADGLVIRAGAAPPFAKFEALRTNDSRFAKTWERKRRDLKDSSASAYCLSLAYTALAAGWSRQEVCDLIVAFREKEPDCGPKLGRHCGCHTTWHGHTIDKAGEVVRAETAVQDLADAADAGGADASEVLDGLSKVLGTKVLAIRREVPARRADSKYDVDPSYAIDVEGRSIHVRDPSVLLSRQRFATLIAGQIGRVIPRMKADQWDRFAQTMLNAAKTVEAAPEGSEYEMVRSLLAAYVERATTVQDDPIAAVQMSACLKMGDDGRTYFGWHAFAKWLRRRHDLRYSNRDMSRILDGIGCRRRTFENLVGVDGQRTRAAFWSVPDGEAA